MLLEAELKEIIKKYSLTQDELYRHDAGIMLVSQRGIRKIISVENMNVTKRANMVGTSIAVMCRVEVGSSFDQGYRWYEAIGESSPENTTFKFPIAVAEARAQSRAVLSFIKLYEKGVIGEMELDLETEAAAVISKRKEQVNTATESLITKITKGKKP